MGGVRSSRLVVIMLVLVALVTVAFTAGCGGSGEESGNPTGLAPSSDPALDAGRLLIDTKCALCHNLDRVKQAEKDRAGWETTIARMRSNGLVMTDQEVQTVLAYLESR